MKAGIVASGRALVLGGGGVTGVAWETGLLLGLVEAGIDLAAADLFVGTSAGAVVAAQLTSGVPIADLFAAQLAQDSSEIAAHLGLAAIAQIVLAMAWPGDRQRARARLGHAALRARTVPEAERRAVIERRLPRHDWPQQRLLIPAVNTATGAVVVFDHTSGISLINAVAASCAVPLVWPPVTIEGQRYMDGGMRSATNADLAAGAERIVVIAPTASVRRDDHPATQIARMGANVRFAIVSPDAASRTAIGRNVLDPAHRAPAAQAGRAQALAVAQRIRDVWS